MVQSTWSRGSRAAHQGHSATRLPEPVRQVAWFSGISLLAFLTPFLFSSLLDLQHDLYYLLYFAITLGALSLYVKANGVDVAARAARNWKLSLGVGLAAAAFVVWGGWNQRRTPAVRTSRSKWPGAACSTASSMPCC